MGFYESPEKILAGADYPDLITVRLLDCALTGFGNRAVYLYVILKRAVFSG